MDNPTLDADVIVIGAGISGLTSAVLLREQGIKVLVLEAHNEVGGRVKSVMDVNSGVHLADLGPTWVWPDMQPVVSRWLSRLNLSMFPQFSSGLSVVEFEANGEPVRTEMPTQDGNVRILGGSQELINQLRRQLPDDVVKTSVPVTAVSIREAYIEVSARCKVFRSEKLIVAVPPRIAANTIDWRPELPEELKVAQERMPTWMAPHAKVIAIYDVPFWRRQGLSGRIASRIGPIIEAHDHCGPGGEPAAIFGFIGWPVHERERHSAELVDKVADQLSRCFGPAAPKPRSVHVKDWAADPFVTVGDDLTKIGGHPLHGPDMLRRLYFDDRIAFASAEVALQSPGLIEGAFVAAENAVDLLVKTNVSTH